MKQRVNFAWFLESFRMMGRYEQFGYDALRVLFDYLEDLESDTGEEIELDVIALCCDYSVYTLDEFQRDYGTEYESIEDIANEFVIIPVDEDSFIVGA
jgi:hypothetical protein